MHAQCQVNNEGKKEETKEEFKCERLLMVQMIRESLKEVFRLDGILAIMIIQSDGGRASVEMCETSAQSKCCLECGVRVLAGDGCGDLPSERSAAVLEECSFQKD